MNGIDLGKIKIAFNNVRSLHKHFKDIEFEPNGLAADVISFAESRLCKRDENVHFALKRFSLVRLDDTGNKSANRPHHGFALYVKEYFHVQEVVKLHCQSCEFILAKMHSIQKEYFQIVVLYRYQKSSRTDFIFICNHIYNVCLLHDFVATQRLSALPSALYFVLSNLAL